MNDLIFSVGNLKNPITEKLKVKDLKTAKNFNTALEKMENKLSRNNNDTVKVEGNPFFKGTKLEKKNKEESKDTKNLEEISKDIDFHPIFNDNLHYFITNGKAPNDNLITLESDIPLNILEITDELNLEIILENMEEIDGEELKTNNLFNDNFHYLDLLNKGGIHDRNAIDISEDIEAISNNKANENLSLELTKDKLEENKEGILFENREVDFVNVENITHKESYIESEKNQQEPKLKLDSAIENIEIHWGDKELKNNNDIFINMENNNISYLEDSSIEFDVSNPIDTKEMIEQIVDRFKIDFSNSKNQITINLKPEVLGKMTMNIEVIKDTVIAKIMVDNHRTKEILENNLIQLKEGIKDTGLEIKTFEVFVGNNSDFNKHSSNMFNFQQNNKKMKLNPREDKVISNYEEKIQEMGINKKDPYMLNSLNLLA